jgi:type II secretion system protein L
MNRLIFCFTNHTPLQAIAGRWRFVSTSSDDLGEHTGEFNTPEQLVGLAARFAGARIEVYLTGEHCPTYWVHLPKKKRDAILSIPYQLEPLLTESIDLLHFTPLLAISNDQQYPVWVCTKQWLEQWIDFLVDVNIHPSNIAPDYSLLWQNGDFHFVDYQVQLKLDERLLVAGGINASGRSDFINVLLSTQHRALTSKPTDKTIRLDALECLDGEQIDLIQNPDNPKGARDNLALLSFETLRLNNKRLSGNLLSGIYKQKPKKTNRLAYIAAGVLGIGLLLNLTVGYIQQTALVEQHQTVTKEVESVFKSALPTARMVDPLFQLQQVQQQRSLAGQTPELLNVLNLFSGHLGHRSERPLSTLSFSYKEQTVHILYTGTKLPSLPSNEKYKMKMLTQDGGLHRVDVIW